MATKTIVIGRHNTEVQTPIQFAFYVDAISLEIVPAKTYPRDCKFIELICNNYNQTPFDLMFAYSDENRRGYMGGLYLGYWNSGIV